MKKNRNLKNKDRSEYKKLHRRSEKKKSRDRRRQLKQGADYHVTCSINNMEHLMKPDEIKVLYEKVLAECKRKYVFLVIHFGIMDNHVHLIIRPGRESLSKIMQWLNSVFAMRFNRLTGRCGHVWKCRFWSKIIDRIEQFKAVFDYISFNFPFLSYRYWCYIAPGNISACGSNLTMMNLCVITWIKRFHNGQQVPQTKYRKILCRIRASFTVKQTEFCLFKTPGFCKLCVIPLFFKPFWLCAIKRIKNRQYTCRFAKKTFLFFAQGSIFPDRWTNPDAL